MSVHKSLHIFYALFCQKSMSEVSAYAYVYTHALQGFAVTILDITTPASCIYFSHRFGSKQVVEMPSTYHSMLRVLRRVRSGFLCSVTGITLSASWRLWLKQLAKETWKIRYSKKETQVLAQSKILLLTCKILPWEMGKSLTLGMARKNKIGQEVTINLS